MRNIPTSSLLTLALALGACTATAPVNDTQQSSSAQEQSSSSSVDLDENAYRGVDEEDAALFVWHAVEAWAPTPWLAPKEGVTTESIIIDDDLNAIPAGAVRSASIEADIDRQIFDEVFMATDSRKGLDAALKKDGWMPHLPIDADGPTGTVWGYRRNAEEGMRFLIISAICSKDVEDPSVGCSQWKATATITAALAKDDDL